MDNIPTSKDRSFRGNHLKLKILAVTTFLLLTCLYWSCGRGTTPISPASATATNVKVPLTSLSRAMNNNNNVAAYQLYYMVTSPSSAPVTGSLGPIQSSTVNGYYDFAVNIPNSSYNLISIQVDDAQAQTVMAVGAEGFTFVPGSSLPVTLGPMHQCYAPVTLGSGYAYGFEGNTTTSVGANIGTSIAGLDMVCNIDPSGGFWLQNASLAQATVAYMGNGLWVNYLTVPPTGNFFMSSGQSKGYVIANNSTNPNNYPVAVGDVYCVKILSGGYAWLQVTAVGNYVTFEFRPNTTLNYCGYEQTNIDKSGACGNNGTPIPTWVPLGAQGFNGAPVSYVSMAFDNSGNTYVAYQDNANSFKASVMEYTGGAWTQVGTPGFSPGPVTYLSLQVVNNVPYVAFSDGSYAGKAMVMDYSGGSWVTLGTPDFSSGAASYLSLAMNASVTYVAYSDASLSNGGVVEQYNGTWSMLGSNAFAPSGATYTSLAINSQNNYAYVAYSDTANGGKASVSEWNGGWVIAGNADFSAGAASYISLGIDSNNSYYPYVVYSDAANGGKATMMNYYNSVNWTTVGSAGFTPGAATYDSIAFNSQGPFVAFADGSNGNQATAMAYLSGSWVFVGNTDFSGGAAAFVCAGFNPAGFDVAYQDTSHGTDATVMQFQ